MVGQTEDRRSKFFEGVEKKEFDKSKIKVPFGKYKGKLLADVIEFDPRYAKWMYSQEYMKKFIDIYDVLVEHFS